MGCSGNADLSSFSSKRGVKKKWTASVHAFHMPKPVITFVFKVLRYGLLRYMTHAQTCDNVRVQSATLWTASVHDACPNL